MAERADSTLADFDAPDARTPTAAPARIAGRYEVLGLLGSGGMGTVYKVRDLELDEIVALKLIRSNLLTNEALERFRNEVRLARKVTHPNVVRTFDLGEHGDERFLTMEYVDARPISWVLADGPLDPTAAAATIAEVCAGVTAAHAAGVLHRDLKPDNVLVSEADAAGRRRVAITDFGIAVASGTRAGGLIGTPAYMAPEQVEGREIDVRADVYAIGAILYELITGYRAWPGADPNEVAAARLKSPPPDPRRYAPIGDELAEVIQRCMARDLRHRFGSADDVAMALRAAMSGETGRAARLSAPVLAAGARSLAIVPMRCAEADRGLAIGFAEELVGLLAVSRDLAVRPLDVVLRAGESADPREVGRALAVEAVLCGTIRRSAASLIVTARLISVDDGVQIWGSRIECAESDLLVSADALATDAVAALSRRIVVPARSPTDPRVVSLYLRARHLLRVDFETGNTLAAAAVAQEGLAIAPSDPGLLAVYALICARRAFYSIEADAPELQIGADAAARAIAAAPESGEAWQAHASIALYRGDPVEAVRALSVSVRLAPGNARAQALLGGLLIDIGRLDAGMARLEASLAVDPLPWFNRCDLLRGHVYKGDWERANAVLASASIEPLSHAIAAQYAARFCLWTGGKVRAFPIDEAGFAHLLYPGHPATPVSMALIEVCQRGRFSDELAAEVERTAVHAHRRLRAALGQFYAEAAACGGRIETALASVEAATAAGLHDLQWMDHCGAIDAIRGEPRFEAARAIVAARANAMLAVLP